MKKIVDLIFYIFGLGLPILIVLVALFKKSKHKFKNFCSKLLIAVIIFAVFYILKIGGLYMFENDIINNNNDAHLTTTNITTKKVKIVSKENEPTYIDGILIVNKTYPLPKDFVPKNTHKSAEGLTYCSECIDEDAYQAYLEMKSDATAIGLNIYIQSGYRSYSFQNDLYNKYVDKDGKLAADTYSARPGYSEHQSGLAFDLNSITDEFQYTDEGKWVNNNCYKYGFILRYPKGKEDETGYKYESWHLRYVGKDLSKTLYNDGDWITLEDYLNITSKYD